MSTPVLVTKLFAPQPKPNTVSRPRLVERLNEGLYRKLSLISAPTGFGKTTLVSEWIARCGRPAAWLSLDEGDNDPARFVTHLVAALQTIAADTGEGVLGALQSPQPPPIEAILTALLNEISRLPIKLMLVLDDYHVIDARPVDSALTFLLEHLPAQMHLVISTRDDPQLPLARLRAKDQLTELRAADLRFAASEADEFLNAVMRLGLSPADVAALEDRTEGWIAGLQLAALSMRGHQDVPKFIREFSGDHQYIVDYLVEEVLQHQPESVRSFLLQTAILERLNGPLCDAVTGQNEGSARLDLLERGNFFVIPLDDRRQWYRYHHLFAAVLKARLIAEQPNQVPALHRRASEWYESNGLPPDAIRHALAGEDFERAAELVELAVPAMLRTRQEATVLGWLEALPVEVVRARPMLSGWYAGTLLSSGKLQGVEDWLRQAERWLDTTEETGTRSDTQAAAMVVADKEAFRRLPGSIALWRAGQSLVLGDVAGTVTYAHRVLDLAPEDDHLTLGGAAGLLGLAYWTSGDLKAGYRNNADCMASIQKAGHISAALGCSIALADIRITQGRLREAMRIYERGLELATEQGTPVLRGAADMHVGMSALFRERNDLSTAMQHLLRSKDLGEHNGLPQNPYRWRVAMARLREAEGDLDDALDLLNEAERVYAGDFFPYVRPVAARKTRMWVAQGRLDEALDWASEQGLSAHDDLSYLREFEHITLARVLLAWHKRDRADRYILEAMELLERLMKLAEEGERTGSLIEILTLRALAHQMQGDISAAIIPLERALKLAEPEGYVRIFVDEGSAMAALLEKATKHVMAPNYVRQLLRSFGRAEDRAPSQLDSIEPLSEREAEVLRLLVTDLDGPDIARELVVSLNTLRTHTKNIYSKLGVNTRLAAVRRAEELHLL